MDSYIFLVGRSDSHHETATAIRKLGYKVGIFHDITTLLADPTQFDVILPVDFSMHDFSITIPSNVTIAGLQSTYENYIVAKAKIGKQLGLHAISEKAALACTDKLLMREAFSQSAAAFSPQFSQVASVDEIRSFAINNGYPVIIKPANLVKSLLVMRCDNEQELIENFTYAQEHISELYEQYGIKDRTPHIIAERFIVGKSCSIAAFVDHAGTAHFCDGIVDITTAKEHGVDDNYLYARSLPLEVDDTTRLRLFEAAKAGISALGMTSSAAHVELIYDETSVGIIEIGARIGGYRPRMYNASYGLDLHEQEIKIALGEIPELTSARTGSTTVIELFPTKPGPYQKITNLDELKKLPSLAYLSVKPTPGQNIGKAAQGHKAAAIVMLHSVSYEQLRQDIAYVKNNIKVVVDSI